MKKYRSKNGHQAAVAWPGNVPGASARLHHASSVENNAWREFAEFPATPAPAPARAGRDRRQLFSGAPAGRIRANSKLFRRRSRPSRRPAGHPPRFAGNFSPAEISSAGQRPDFPPPPQTLFPPALPNPKRKKPPPPPPSSQRRCQCKLRKQGAGVVGFFAPCVSYTSSTSAIKIKKPPQPTPSIACRLSWRRRSSVAGLVVFFAPSVLRLCPSHGQKGRASLETPTLFGRAV
jgi:hypothetical protein